MIVLTRQKWRRGKIALSAYRRSLSSVKEAPNCAINKIDHRAKYPQQQGQDADDNERKETHRAMHGFASAFKDATREALIPG